MPPEGLHSGGEGSASRGLGRPAPQHYRIQSTSGRYLSYWNAVLFTLQTTDAPDNKSSVFWTVVRIILVLICIATFILAVILTVRFKNGKTRSLPPQHKVCRKVMFSVVSVCLQGDPCDRSHVPLPRPL